MGRSKRSSPQGADRTEQWLGPERVARPRPWAYRELLLGANDDGTEDRGLSSLAADLAVDLAELKRMQNELYDHVVRIARLEGRLQALMSAQHGEVRVHAAAPADEIRSLPSGPIRTHGSLEAGSSLARCEGFRVESPSGFVGFVEGLRFLTRIDEPDLLEVRGGRFGREPMLIPVEAVEEISLAEERLLIRTTPRLLQDDYVHELVNRLRKALHHPVRSE
jgi:hypothetical protein